MKKILSAILTVSVAAGLFAGVGSMEVKAAAYSVATANSESDVELIKQNGEMRAPEAIAYIGSNVSPVTGDIVWCWYDDSNSFYNYLKYDTSRVPNGWEPISCTSATLTETFNGAATNYLLGVDNPAIGGSTPDPITPATSPSKHEHNYTWTTVQEVTADRDGIEEYRCSCGNVKERDIIPVAEYIVKGLCGAIKNAPVNGTATYDSLKIYCITDKIIKQMAERSDVTTVITFEYEGIKYQMTVPAGTDFTSVLTDEEYFYGYFGFAAKVGATISTL